MTNGDITNEQIRAWADEAERGYDVEFLRGRIGRPRLDIDGPAQVVPVRLTPAQLARLDERVARDGTTRSEALRTAVDAYLAS
ncbi:MAG: ribbon-helix-helix protein, CopG family [Dermatophilus congolensis]|nr:ribbon-helix-helix protein, CopG family [Dermatophilus congolensis]